MYNSQEKTAQSLVYVKNDRIYFKCNPFNEFLLGGDMNQFLKLKLFVSYSHDDEEHVKSFIKHVAPLRSKGLQVVR
jgi:hypothetical protein